MANSYVASGVNGKKEIVRPVATFSPSLWGNIFIKFTHDKKLEEEYAKEIELLKDEVKGMLTSPQREMMGIMKLIDTIERLGIAYHFEDEIEHKLEHIFNLNTNYEDSVDDLYTVSLHFRLFRQHGYRINSDIFGKFKDATGKFKETLTNDAEGLLSLYEAVPLRTHGEDILEEALQFSKLNLKSMAPSMINSPLKKQVEHALVQQLHMGTQRIESHYYISIYKEEESRSELLLKFAKLDYNLVQMMHKQEISQVASWWKDLDLAPKLPYARDRVVECYSASMGTYHEPQYSRGRVMLAKSFQMISLIDDTYDVYGTIEELDVFTEAIQRWDISEIDRLPEYMKVLYTEILKLYDQFDEELAEEGRPFAVYYAREALKEQVSSHYAEAKWFIEGHFPSFSEYTRHALITSSYCFITISSLLGIKSSTKANIEWLSKKPISLMASMKLARFINDMVTHEPDKERGLLATGIEIYTKENGVTVEEGINDFLKMAENAWKDFNEDFLRPFPCEKYVLTRTLNLIRNLDVAYKNNEDGYSRPERAIKLHIIAMFIKPFKI